MSVPDRLAAALADRYRIERELGEGGMAKVYLAQDLKHARRVAIKVLRPELAAVVGGDRFISEIRTTANLQHPHILPLFDSGEAGSFLWYAMPYIEGETLREKLDREKQLPVPEAIAIAVKVAGALQTAHDAGIIHRDIKPANILLANGEPLVADFGIALAVQEAGGGRLTETGLSVGTPYYMSPEQATADRDPDARSDLYSLACLVYEMIAGDPPFTGGTAQAVLGQILTQAPPRVTSARPSTPPNVEAALLQALQKLPADRFETVADFAKALTNETYVGPAARATGAYGATRPAGSGLARWAPWAVAAAAAGVAAMSFATGGDGRPDGPRPDPVRFTLEDRSDWFGGGRNLAISADGSVLAYQDLVDGRPVWVRRDFRQVGAEPLPRSEGALYAAVSPRGRWIAWDSGPDSVLYRIQPGASVPLVMAHPRNPLMGISWRDESTILGGMLWFDGDYPFVQSASIDDSTLVQVSAPAVDGGFGMHHEPYVLPGGTHALVIDFQDDVGFSVLDLEDGTTRRIDLGGASPRTWAAITGVSGDVLLFREQGPRLMAIGWDPDRMETVGRPRAVPGINGFVEDAALAHDGTLALLFAPSAFRPVLVDDRGQVLRDLGIDDVGRHMFPRTSPNGTLVYLEGGVTGNHRDWMVDLRSNTVRDFPVAADRRSAFGERIGDWVDAETFAALFEVGQVDGPDPVQLVARSSRPEAVGERPLLADTLVEWEQLEVSPIGGHAMVTRQRDEGNQLEMGVLDLATGDVTPFAGLGTGSAFAPRISPDGTRVAFVVDVAGLPEVYVTSFPTQGVVTRVSAGRAGQPVWNPSGNGLYYISPDGLTAVDLVFESEDGLASVVGRQILFDLPMFGDASSEVATYDVHPDGFVLALEEGDDTGRIEVWKNWIGELRPVLERPGPDGR
jgi:serine/threonine-protein kinase